ncbi:hypothetical protein Tco_0849871 [Tanacetum coccineum]
MFKYIDTENEAVCLMMFPLSLTGEATTWLDELNEGTIETKIAQEVLNAAAGGIFLYKTQNQAYQLLEDKVLLKLDWAKNQKTKSSLKKTVAFADEEEAKFMQTFRKNSFYNDYRDQDSNRDNWHSSGRNDCNRDNYRSNTDDKPYDIQKQFNDFMKSLQSTTAFGKDTFMNLKTQLETVAKNHQASIQNLEAKFDRLADKQSGRPSGSLPGNTQPNPRDNPDNQRNNSENPINFDSDDEDDEPTPQPKTHPTKPVKETPLPKPYKPKIPIDVIDEILEEDFDALLDEGSKILHSIEGTLLEEEIFSKFDEFMAMTADENSKFEF